MTTSKPSEASRMRGKSLLPVYPVITVLALLLAPSIAIGDVTIPPSGHFIVDTAGIIDPAVEQRLELWLSELERKTTAQVKVLSVQTTDGEDFFTFVHRHAEAWKLG